MAYRLIAFDLDGTLTRSRLPAAGDLAQLLLRLLKYYQVAVTSGADWPQFKGVVCLLNGTLNFTKV